MAGLCFPLHVFRFRPALQTLFDILTHVAKQENSWSVIRLVRVLQLFKKNILFVGDYFIFSPQVLNILTKILITD